MSENAQTHDTAMLEQVLGIRRHRMDRATVTLKKCQERLLEAAERLRQSTKERDRWKKERPEREERIFLSVKGKSLSRSDLSHTRRMLSELKKQERKRCEAVVEKEKERQIAMDDLDKAHHAYHQATRAMEKMQEVHQRLRDRDRLFDERAQEMEADEFSIPIH